MPIIQELLKHLFKKEPVLKKVQKIYDFIFDLTIVYPYYKIFKSLAVFKFQQSSYYYFLNPYNFTWENERIVEVPIIWKLVKENYGRKIIEVGNVLSRYFCVNHDVVDKYEKTNGIINKDIIDFQPRGKYDLIVSISTFEHIGFDEIPKDPNKILAAIKKVRDMLAPGGKAVITLPLGYHSDLDSLLKEERIMFDEKYYMRRISRLNSWVEVDSSVVCEPRYDKPFRFANWLLIGVIRNPFVK